MKKSMLLRFFILLAIVLLNTGVANASQSIHSIDRLVAFTPYDPGTPTFTDLWVDPIHGNDSNDGASLDTAFRTLTQAWANVPTEPLTQGVRINLQPGTYSADIIPNYWETRYGTLAAPIMIRGNGAAPGDVVLQNTVNMFEVHYVYFENLTIALNGDAFHCELCDHILLRNMILNGGGQAQETIKVNQSQHIYIEDSDIYGAWDNAIDFVSVQYGHIIKNKIHGAGDWCAYVKGGSAYLRVEANIIYNCGTGGFTAGQGTGFQYMTPPWIQYETYDIKVVNNIIHDTEGAGLGVNGGYNILMAYNTMYRVGSRSHVIEVVFGSRSCDGDPGRERCQQYLADGGWGTIAVDDGNNFIRIPNKNVFIYNNIVYNPSGFQSQWQHFAISDPFTNPSDSNVSNAVADDNLRIRGNVIWNGGASMPLGIEDTQACITSNLTCNELQLIADNAINTVEPQFINPASGDFHPSGTWINGVTTYAIPDFTWDVAPDVPPTLTNAVSTDYEDAARAAVDLPGAFHRALPSVRSIVRTDASPTTADTVNFTVTFSEPMSNVDDGDFNLYTEGLTGASISAVNGSDTTYIISVDTGSGSGILRLDLIDNDTITNADLIPLGGTDPGNGNFTSGQTYLVRPLTMTFLSAGTQDGWILESGEKTSKGGMINSTATTIRLGDDKTKKQYRGILSFKTGTLNDNAIITGVTLKVRKQGIAGGGNPVTTFHGFMADIKKGIYGTSASLQVADF